MPQAENKPLAGQCNGTSDNDRFIRKDSGVIVDTKTDLEWYPSPDLWSYFWRNARAWVENLDVDGGA